MKKITLILMIFISSLALGATKSEIKIDSANLIKVEYNEKGLVKSKIYKLETCFEVISYYETGSIREISLYDFDTNRTGEWISYNEEGKVTTTANFKDDKKNGEWKIYDNNGNMVIYMVYKNNKIIRGFQWTENNGIVVK
jgi:antitoxin component YwqK of YwqJK toxin-antitoxin module